MAKRNLIFFLLAIVVSAIIYAFTLCPTVEFIDSGELALAAKNLGVAHPTGYPLYTLLGRLAAILLWGPLIIRVNILSLLFTSFAVGFLYLAIAEIISAYSPSRYKNDDLFNQFVAFAAAIFMAFSPVWWSQGTTNEVYSLNLLLMAASIWSLMKFMNRAEDKARSMVMAVYLLALCFTNHLSAVYLLPGYLFILISELIRLRAKMSVIWILIGFFVFPATLYLFLPIRAHFRPFLNWGGTSESIYYFYKHVTGWQYQVWMFQNPLGAFDNLAKLGPSAKLIFEQYGVIGLLLVIVGLAVSAARIRKLFVFALLIALANLIYVLNYAIADIDSYYLPMFLIGSFFLAAGIMFISSRIMQIAPRNVLVKYILAGLILILPLSNLILNYYKSDRSHKTFARQGVEDLIASMEPNSLAFFENWDFYSPWLYMHFAENYHPDVRLLDKELMRRSWYIDFIRRQFPDIYARSRQEFEEFLRQVKPYEYGKPYDPAVIDEAYYGMIHAVINHEGGSAPVYTNISNDQNLVNQHPVAPDGLLFRFFAQDKFLERPPANFDEAYWGNKLAYEDVRVAYLLSFYTRAYESRARYCQFFRRNDEASYYKNLESKVAAIIDNIDTMK